MSETSLKCQYCAYKVELPEDGMADREYRMVKTHMQTKHRGEAGRTQAPILSVEAGEVV